MDLYDHLDIPEFINYFACRVVLMHGDDVRKNFYMYYDTNEDGRLRVFADATRGNTAFAMVLEPRVVRVAYRVDVTPNI